MNSQTLIDIPQTHFCVVEALKLLGRVALRILNKFHKRTWDKKLGRKRKYYIEEFNPTYNQHQKAYIGANIPWKAKILEEFNPTYNQHQKAYIGANIPWKAKILIAQLRTNSHQLCCETGRWKRPKEAWEERVYFCTSRKVETEKHFILECEAFKDSRDIYVHILAASSWDNLFNEGTMEKLGVLIIKMNRKTVEMHKSF